MTTTDRLRAGMSAVLLAAAILVLWHAPPAGHPRPGPASTPPAADRLEIARQAMPPGLTLLPASHSPCLFHGQAADGSVAWHAVFTETMPGRTAGYAGPIDLLVGIDAQGRVTTVRVLRHQETPTFVEGIDADWFLGQFQGRTAQDRLEPGEDFDGITHATVTVTAMAADIRAALRFIPAAASEPTKTRIPSGAQTGSPADGQAGSPAGSLTAGLACPQADAPATSVKPAPGGAADIGAIPLATWCLAGALLLLVVGRHLRRPVTAAGMLVLLGVVSPQFLSLGHLPVLVQAGRAGLLPPPTVTSFLALAALLALAAPRGYCRFLCPMGGLQDLLTYLWTRAWSLTAAPPPLPASGAAPPEGPTSSPPPAAQAPSADEEPLLPRASPIPESSATPAQVQPTATPAQVPPTATPTQSPPTATPPGSPAPAPGEEPLLLATPARPTPAMTGPGSGEPSAAAPLPSPAPVRVWPLGRVLAWGALAALAAGHTVPLERLEIFATLFLWRGGLAATLLILAAVAGALLLPRFYCRSLCPLHPLFEDLETGKALAARPWAGHPPPVSTNPTTLPATPATSRPPTDPPVSPSPKGPS